MHSLVSEVPSIDTSSLPEEEKPYGEVVWYQLRNLALGVDSFSSALQMFDFCDREQEKEGLETAEILKYEGLERAAKWRALMARRSQEPAMPYLQWQIMAGREGGMTL